MLMYFEFNLCAGEIFLLTKMEVFVIDVLEKSEKLINTESQVRKAIREGMDPQEAYIKYSVF